MVKWKYAVFKNHAVAIYNFIIGSKFCYMFLFWNKKYAVGSFFQACDLTALKKKLVVATRNINHENII